ncbi:MULTISPECIES: phosphoadenosine phosphosulfate reductase family protein [unclassified Pseudomonas]|uniref:phosphoadenosine phosphosulfate reductase domain-containing protein n=1 Tax=unclassified Pseudomonas TaxID=196821 RepID=UPI0016132E3C|nr:MULTISPECIES: phosphoadenosine phosphosulfate reductase family protein [unclassified Pseudomonas]MBB6287969.1 3'-phosphoadenosine 5'-phosphosulfate sulfotransferase (PAPS reductase)/FAD synthetase [Pseudomonas sp. SJZ073]MBB6312941.1 3'-phosphoadenosine 5'-phosphosulfate sulfotransferase (PAPS reductase)/FAD synthetase [Pseudomonas sp. JAI120]
MTTHNIISLSGGKDSTATLLVAIALEAPNLQAVFADTGNEHQQTHEYLDYLEQATRTKITRVRADFTQRIEGKRRFIESKWRAQGIAEEVVLAALDVLQPTGNPFLDLCIWKGRFPSRKAQFCTIELKRDPMFEQVVMPLMGAGDMILSWQGVRAEESLNRRYLPECDEVGGGLFNYRPILKWDIPAVFEAHRYMGIKPNPLYSQGMGRVGCMPCINCRKDELREIALRFPDVIDRIDRWERTVQQASKRGAATFFAGSNAKHPKGSIANMSAIEVMEIASIRQAVEWSKTARGGIQYDLMIATDAQACSSAYGLCDTDPELVKTPEAA